MFTPTATESKEPLIENKTVNMTPPTLALWGTCDPVMDPKKEILYAKTVVCSLKHSNAILKGVKELLQLKRYHPSILRLFIKANSLDEIKQIVGWFKLFPNYVDVCRELLTEKLVNHFETKPHEIPAIYRVFLKLGDQEGSNVINSDDSTGKFTHATIISYLLLNNFKNIALIDELFTTLENRELFYVGNLVKIFFDLIEIQQPDFDDAQRERILKDLIKNPSWDVFDAAKNRVILHYPDGEFAFTLPEKYAKMIPSEDQVIIQIAFSKLLEQGLLTDELATFLVKTQDLAYHIARALVNAYLFNLRTSKKLFTAEEFNCFIANMIAEYRKNPDSKIEIAYNTFQALYHYEVKSTDLICLMNHHYDKAQLIRKTIIKLQDMIPPTIESYLKPYIIRLFAAPISQYEGLLVETLNKIRGTAFPKMKHLPHSTIAKLLQQHIGKIIANAENISAGLTEARTLLIEGHHSSSSSSSGFFTKIKNTLSHTPPPPPPPAKTFLTTDLTNIVTSYLTESFLRNKI